MVPNQRSASSHQDRDSAGVRDEKESGIASLGSGYPMALASATASSDDIDLDGFKDVYSRLVEQVCYLVYPYAYMDFSFLIDIDQPK